MKKHIKSKQMKTKRPSASVAAKQDIVGLLTMLTQKLTSFEAKVDMILSRIPSQPSVVPHQQPALVHPTQQRRESRPMYKVICANCGRDSEVPFKPSGNRPVYCKKCFAARKNNGIFKPQGDNRLKELPQVPVLPPEKPKVVKPAKLAKKKKPVVKKKKKHK